MRVASKHALRFWREVRVLFAFILSLFRQTRPFALPPARGDLEHNGQREDTHFGATGWGNSSGGCAAV